MAFDQFEGPATTAGTVQDLYLKDEATLLAELTAGARLSDSRRDAIRERAIALAASARAAARRGPLVDKLLQEYGLSSAQGVTLMRLCEALIRTPDPETARALLRDKIGSGDWATHAARSESTLVNLTTRGLQLSEGWIAGTGGPAATNLLARLGDGVLHRAISQAMRLIGDHFVLGGSIEHAIRKSGAFERRGATFSYDMLGEAAHTEEDARRYFDAYHRAVTVLARNARGFADIAEAPGVSVKLSALHPRYEYTQRERCVPVLAARVKALARIAGAAGIGLTIDAEEADRLETSLLVIEHLLSDPDLENWNGLGVVVQAYQRRAGAVIDHLARTARAASRRIAVRLVKGAYWDMEIKRAQELGLSSYPVFTRKENTDVSYLSCAQRLLDFDDVIFPQFATHNAHTAAAIIEMAGDGASYEFQRLYGMGQPLHDALAAVAGTRCRIYAPVGRHRDLLPYLVRRLLENGANGSFVNQLVDPAVAIETVVSDPFEKIERNETAPNPEIPAPRDLFDGTRQLAAGMDFTYSADANALEALAAPSEPVRAFSIINGARIADDRLAVTSPTTNRRIGSSFSASPEDVERAIEATGDSMWVNGMTAANRAACLETAADLLERHPERFLSLCVNEAGKSFPDAIAEVREAVDFCRYYAGEARSTRMHDRSPLGVVACISPWNFPLAIFLGQVTAALAAGNRVVAKPAEQTAAIAHEAVRLLYRAGVPEDALHLAIGDGPTVGHRLVASAGVDGICFTGSTATAKRIASCLADTGRPLVPLIAETGGINAMIVDATALMEQAVADVVASAFQSAGQRCSACRVVCVQEDIAEAFIAMLSGSMALLQVGDPGRLETDVGPVIDTAARERLSEYIRGARERFEPVGESPLPEDLPGGHFIAPVAFEIPSVSSLSEEVFGPVLHVLRYRAADLDGLIEEINGLGYGLTMGLHTRIDERIAHVARLAKVGNLYVNRDQIGAVVGVHPFGGEGLSGTGPKAGGPHYLMRLSRPSVKPERPALPHANRSARGRSKPGEIDAIVARARGAFEAGPESDLYAIFESAAQDIETRAPELGERMRMSVESARTRISRDIPLPGPTGEKNTLSLRGRGVILCAGDAPRADVETGILKTLLAGNSVIVCAPASRKERLAPLYRCLIDAGLPRDLFTWSPIDSLTACLNSHIDGVMADGPDRRNIANHLCRRAGPIIPVLSAHDDDYRFCVERTLTVNTTAAGGNAGLLAM